MLCYQTLVFQLWWGNCVAVCASTESANKELNAAWGGNTVYYLHAIYFAPCALCWYEEHQRIQNILSFWANKAPPKTPLLLFWISQGYSASHLVFSWNVIFQNVLWFPFKRLRFLNKVWLVSTKPRTKLYEHTMCWGSCCHILKKWVKKTETTLSLDKCG